MLQTEIDRVEIDRIAPTRRPVERLAGYQRWRDLLFLHWEVPADALEPLLPRGLTLDTHDGRAWVGLVPFAMSGVRPCWFPALPRVSCFLETNVRTYVHYRGKDPGVWFFSLDAANSLAVRVARWRWSLPYHRANMQLTREGSRVRYASRRLWPGTRGAGLDIEIEAGEPLREPGMPPGHARPGTLEHFLAERYFLYAESPRVGLLKAQVHHTPYPLRQARVLRCEETLLNVAGIARTGEPAHALFSDGVDVEIFPLKPVVG